MEGINDCIHKVADYFCAQLAPSLIDVYKLGSLAHGGFSDIYSDLDVGVILSCEHPPKGMDGLIVDARKMDPIYGKKLSIFWGNPQFSWGRLPVLDRLDLLDHGVPLLNGTRAAFPRPSRADIRRALRESIERSWRPRIASLRGLIKLEPEDRKPYIRCVLYPARLIFSWDRLGVDSNDRAVAYLREVRPRGLDLKPIELALTCRHGQCEAEQVFDLKVDLHQQFEKSISYISENSRS